MSGDRIENELGRLLEDATPGPWVVRAPRDPMAEVYGHRWGVWEQCDPEGDSLNGVVTEYGGPRRSDATLVAELRSHAPALLDVARAARALCDAPPDSISARVDLEEALDRLDAGGDDGE